MTEPTVFADVDPNSELAQTEVIGPVLAITPFRSDEEAIEIASKSSFGLSGYIHTRSLERAHVIAEKNMVTGEVLINGP